MKDKETIQAEMLENIDDSYDKSEGSFFYDVLKPVAIKLEELDLYSDEILNKIFIDTATGEDLTRKAEEMGVKRKIATKATGTVKLTGVVGATILKGEIVASDNLNFIILENSVVPTSGEILVKVECEQFGSIGNVPSGAIKYFPKTLEGLYSVTNEEPISNGYDEETDESLRERYYTKVRTPATSGNKYHYLNWAKEVTGVGDAKVYPLAYGNGTVKMVIINSNKQPADSNLIQDVKAYIESVRPIGATITVESAVKKDINISLNITIDTENYTLDMVKSYLETNISNYLKSIAFKSEYVSYAKIGGIILSTEGVLDYSSLTINGVTSNVSISINESCTEIAVLGGVNIE